jgi:hypothetical protein
VYQPSKLPLREFEAARISIARVNHCATCRKKRRPRDVENH